MAPQNKREAEESEEVVKRLKDDIKTSESGDDKATEAAETKQQVDSKNNNNNNEESSAATKSSTNGAAKAEAEKSEQQSNGDKKQESEQLASNGRKQETPKEIEDKKKEEVKVEDAAKTVEPAGETKTEAEQEETNEAEEEDDTVGTLLICGGANWDMTGRKELPKTAKRPTEVNPAARNLWGPTKVVMDGKPLRVRGVFSGCNACHSVVVTEDGQTLTFGRNDKGQLGLGDTETRIVPEVVEALRDIDIVAAACGRSHTLFLDSDGIVYACGDNKMGQCGTNQMAVQQINIPTRIAFKENKPVVKMACGAEFSMIVDEEGRLYSFGHPEHGQLGHNSEGKYFTTGNKYAFHCEYQARRIVTFIEKSREGHVTPVDEVFITDVACGTNHTLAVDKKNRCYSWGFAGYHRLGHSETKNELVPRSIQVFNAPTNSGRGAKRVFAGASHSMAIDVNGLVYFWGQNKSSGEATMYPKNVQDLCGLKIKSMSCANRSIFVVAEDMCVSWGPSPTYGELGYGEGKSKSSTVPQEVKTMDGVVVHDVACGFGHTLLIARDTKAEDKSLLEAFESWP